MSHGPRDDMDNDVYGVESRNPRWDWRACSKFSSGFMQFGLEVISSASLIRRGARVNTLPGPVSYEVIRQGFCYRNMNFNVLNGFIL